MEYVKVRQKPVKNIDKDLVEVESQQQFFYDGAEYRLGRTEVKSIPSYIATAWSSASTVIEIMDDLGSF